MRKYPNCSIITLLTEDSDNGLKKLLFIFVKPVPTYFDNEKIYWYDGTGKNGSANLVWQSKKIRQWFGCGKDEIIKKLFEHITLMKEFKIGSNGIKLTLPVYNKRIYKPNPFFDRSQNPATHLIVDTPEYFPQQFRQKENLRVLCGYQPGNTDLKGLFPVGLFDEHFLYDRVKEGVFGITEERKAYLTYHGVKSSGKKGDDIDGMTGFYQEDFKKEATYSAVYKNSEGTEIGRAQIDRVNGIFHNSITDASGKGTITILVDDLAIKTQEYTLIKDIKFNFNIITGNTVDMYGRTITKTEQPAVRPVSVNNFSWQKDAYAVRDDANKILSDRFLGVLNYLGPKILIADPYFIGDIKENQATHQFELKDCQTSLLNAVAMSAVSTGIAELNIMGYNSRAKDHFDLDPLLPGTATQQRADKYDRLLRTFIVTNNLSNYLKPSSIYFRNAPKDFHSRNWFSISEDGQRLEKCVILTNSIGNIEDVDFLCITEPAQLLQLTSKFNDLFKRSTNELTI